MEKKEIEKYEKILNQNISTGACIGIDYAIKITEVFISIYGPVIGQQHSDLMRASLLNEFRKFRSIHE